MSKYKLPRHSDLELERRKELRPETMARYPRTGVRWSIEEEGILVTLFEEESKQIYQIAKELERSAGAIAARLEYFGLIGGAPSAVNNRSKKQPSPPPSLTAYELGRQAAEKQFIKKQTAKKKADEAIASSYLIRDTRELPRHSDSQFEILRTHRPLFMETYSRHGVPWSIKEDRFLIYLHEGGRNIEEISQDLERTLQAIRIRFRRLGL